MQNRRLDLHTTEDDLIRLLDGELDKGARARVQSHLESCWGCRHLQERIRKAMDRFAEWECEIACASEAQPPSDWGGFAAKLHAAARIPLPATPAHAPLLRRTAATFAGAAALLASCVWLWPVSTVSASELLDRSSRSEKALVARVENPVVLQKIRIETPRRRAEGVFWNAPTAGKSRRYWGSAGDGSLGTEIERIYSKVGMDFGRPVSIFNHASWRKSIQDHRDQVEQQEGYVRLRTRNGVAKAGEIVEAEVLIRSSDWHAVEQSFTIAGLSERYRIVETAYDVKPLNFETARLFDPAPAAASASMATSILPSIPHAGVNESSLDALDAPTHFDLRTLSETEIEVLAMLRELDADQREAARVERRTDSVSVVLYASDDERTRFITRELSAVPHVRLTVHRLDDSAKEPHQRTAPRAEPAPEKAEPPLFLRELAATAGSLPVANLLTGRQMESLRRMKSDLVSLEDLTLRFPEDTRRALSPAADARLRNLMRGYFDEARRTWVESISSSALLLGALGIQADGLEPTVGHACEWPQSAHDLAFGARRLEELYSRAFTSVAGADTALRWLSKGALREEVATLHGALSDLFEENCRP